MPRDPARGAPARRRLDVILPIALVVVAVGGVGLVGVYAESRLSSATMGLMAATAGLLLCLRAMYRFTSALVRPSLETALEQEAVLGLSSHRELREEKRRLVRAINELTFDHEMGKLSKADYDAVREIYELQAIDVIRALESDRDLHPELLERLKSMRPAEGEAAASEPVEDPSAVRTKHDVPTPEDLDPPPEAEGDPEADDAHTCPQCETNNDADARFCKSCGAALETSA